MLFLLPKADAGFIVLFMQFIYVNDSYTLIDDFLANASRKSSLQQTDHRLHYPQF